MIISPETKKLIIEFLISSKAPPFGNEDKLFPTPDHEFLFEVFNIGFLKETDKNYIDVDFETSQYLYGDYDMVELFLNRLHLVNNEERFIKFLETVISSTYRQDEEDIIQFVIPINDLLENEGLELKKTNELSNNLPVYLVDFITDPDVNSLDLRKSSFLFFVRDINGKISPDAKNHSAYFELYADSWDDFHNKTTFYLIYYDNKQSTNIGKLKIMNKTDLVTVNTIPEKFNMLPESFCSLGQHESYYLQLQMKFGLKITEILHALCDCVISTNKLERFENHKRFRESLIRTDEAERLTRRMRYKLYKYNFNQLFKFTYKFKPLYSSDSIDITFNFNENENLPDRIFAIIGKNGTGKTQLLNSLTNSISQNKTELFLPQVPIFSKVIHVSYSVFDNFRVPINTKQFNYQYCGLRNEKGDWISPKGLRLRFHQTWKKIKEKDRINKWRKILLNFIEEELLDEFIVRKEEFLPTTNSYNVDVRGFNRVRDRLSSGQSILLYIISEIIANIRYDSLILYDEPETHLHPNAISQLINTIYELVHEFESFCIIGSHSPLIVQELLSKNVFIIEREGNVPSVRRIGIESFGENLSTITNDIFGNSEVPKQYKKIIQELIKLGKNFNEIVELLSFDNRPLSLNTTLYIKSQIQ